MILLVLCKKQKLFLLKRMCLEEDLEVPPPLEIACLGAANGMEEIVIVKRFNL